MMHIISPSMPEETGRTAEEKSSPHPKEGKYASFNYA